MSKIFISYRRSDSIDDTGRLYDHLLKYFDKDEIFKDLDNIPAGEDYDNYIESSIKNAKIMLAVIGKTWLTCIDEKGMKRIEQSDDWIQIEIAMALKWDLTIIPVLVDNATMPIAGQLPPSIQALAKKQASTLRSDPDFVWDMTRLQKAISKTLKESWVVQAKRNKKIKLLVGSTVLIVITTFFTIYFIKHHSSVDQSKMAAGNETIVQKGQVNIPAIPSGNQIKNDLIGKTMLGWIFSNINEIRNFSVIKVDTLKSALNFLINTSLEDKGSFHQSQITTVYKLNEGAWAFDKVVCKYITFNYEVPATGRYIIPYGGIIRFEIPDIKTYRLMWKTDMNAANSYLTPENQLDNLPPSNKYWVQSRENGPVDIQIKYIGEL